jgi:uncharacterized RDD family membrane protein YckC
MVNFCPKCGEYIEEDAKFCDNCGFDLTERKAREEEEIKRDKKGKTLISKHYGEYTTLGPRFVAFLIDFTIIGIINGILWWNVKTVDFSWRPWRFEPIQPWYTLNQVSSFLISFFYWVILETYYGQSLGKMALNIKTVDEKTLEPTTPGRNAMNNLLKAGGIFFVLDFIIGILANYSKPEKRLRIGQNWSKTVVIRVK